jgi:hypothetical protein
MKYLDDVDSALSFIKEESEKQEQNFANSRDPKNDRFFMSKNSVAEVLFIDDMKFFLNEHKLSVKGKYVFETCIADTEGDCPLDDGNRSSMTFVSTILLLAYSKKNSEELIYLDKPFKKLYACKKGNANRLLRRQKEWGSLRGKKFKIWRSSDSKGENTGTDFEYIKDVDLEQLKQVAPEGFDADQWIAPFDYKKIFKPKSADELRQIVGISPPVGSTEDYMTHLNGIPNANEKQQAPAQKKSIQDLV